MTSTAEGDEQKAELIIVGAAEVLTCDGADGPARGEAQAAIGAKRNAAVAIGKGRILAVGDETSVRERFGVGAASLVDATGCVVMPGFVDAHTHLVFGGDRAAEWERRMAGVPYLEILRGGGGIRSTVRATRAAARETLLESATAWAARCLELGTTTVEVKSGYCLDESGELKLLEVIADLAATGTPRIVSTFLGAHVVPAELEDRRADYVGLVVSMLETIRARELADFVDVFCETEAFTVTETRRILERAAELGFGLKIHAEQFTASGAARLGADLGAVSVDHLEHVDDETIRALSEAGDRTVGVLLPAVPFHLAMTDHAPARRLVDAGVPLALATDLNPGSSLTPSMPMVIALACRQLGLSVAEAIVASTINGAHALGLGNEVGSLRAGKRADVIICDVPDHRFLGYAFGFNPVRTVIAGGNVVVERRRAA